MTQLDLYSGDEFQSASTATNGFGLLAQVFSYSGTNVRGLMVHGAPWLVAADVCTVLEIRNNRDALSALDDDEKGVGTVDTPGGPQKMAIINEPGLYSLVHRSRKAEAKKFKRWVTHEVLPALRKTGTYSVPTQREPELDELEVAERYLQALKDKRALLARAEIAETKVAALTPAAENWEQIQGGDGINLKTFRKKYFVKVPERQFFEHLYARGYLIDQRGTGGWSERRQKHRDGWQHRHPAAKGEAFMFLHTDNDRQGERRQSVRVLSGEPELAFRAALISDGLTPTALTHAKEIEA